jgi:hypothetical protein
MVVGDETCKSMVQKSLVRFEKFPSNNTQNGPKEQTMSWHSLFIGER